MFTSYMYKFIEKKLLCNQVLSYTAYYLAIVILMSIHLCIYVYICTPVRTPVRTSLCPLTMPPRNVCGLMVNLELRVTPRLTPTA